MGIGWESGGFGGWLRWWFGDGSEGATLKISCQEKNQHHPKSRTLQGCRCARASRIRRVRKAGPYLCRLCTCHSHPSEHISKGLAFQPDFISSISSTSSQPRTPSQSVSLLTASRHTVLPFLMFLKPYRQHRTTQCRLVPLPPSMNEPLPPFSLLLNGQQPRHV